MNISIAENAFESMAEYATFPPDMSMRVQDMSLRVGQFISPYFISADDWFPSPAIQFEDRRAYPRTLQISGNAPPGQMQETLKKLIEENILQKFAEILNLPPNWDSYNGRPIADHTVEKALSWLASVYRKTVPVPYIVPGSDGSVQIEWHVPGADLEVLFPPRGPAEYYWETEGGSSEGLLADSDNIDRYIGVLVDSTSS